MLIETFYNLNHYFSTLPTEIREQLLTLIGVVFRYSNTSPEQLLDEILRCVKHRDLVGIFDLRLFF